MTHDPLCPLVSPQRWDRYPFGCCCYLIAQVRKEERQKLIELINVAEEPA